MIKTHYTDYDSAFEHYRLGVLDGFHAGFEASQDGWSDLHRHAYRLGYDLGVSLFSSGLDEEDPDGPCLCGRGNCPECGGGYRHHPDCRLA